MGTGGDIGRTANNGGGLGGTNINLANAEFIGIRVGLAVNDFADHHPCGPCASVLNVLNLEACHGEGVGQILWRKLEGHQITEPV